METILHIGAHRTASTTFQAFLESNAGLLRSHGIASWTPRRTRSGLFSGLIRRPQEITLQVERHAARSSGLIRMEQERYARMGLSHLIVSEENMIGAVRNNLRDRTLYPHLDERVIRFRDAFADRCTRILISIRAYDAFWASSLAYAVAQGDRMPDMGLLDRLVAQPRRWRDVIREVAQSFPNAEVVVWPFETFAGRPEAQLAVMAPGRVPKAGLVGTRDWRNASPNVSDLRRMLTDRAAPTPEALLPAGEGRWMPFDTDQRLALASAYRMDLRWLREGAEGFARLVEDPEALATDQTRTEEDTGPGEHARERAAVAAIGGHQDEGSRRTMV